MFTDSGADRRVLEAALDEGLAVGAALGAEQDHQALLAGGTCLGQILAQIEKTRLEPGRIIRAHDRGIVEGRVPGRSAERRGGQQARQPQSPCKPAGAGSHLPAPST